MRELPVFGMLEGVFLVGVIDELHYSHKGELVLSELKTRGPRSLPGRAQERSHYFQVGDGILLTGNQYVFIYTDTESRLKLEMP